MTRAAIVGLGMFAPPDVRSNAWWPKDVVDRWPARGSAALPSELTPGMRVVLEAASRFKDDPFAGVVERRVLAPDLAAIDMEQRAANEAIDRARVDRSQIDLLLLHRVVPEQQLANPACELHERLALPSACLAMYVEATAYSVFAQLALAEAMIVSGRARSALLVQSCTGSRLAEQANPLSTVLGDGATAIVLGPARDAGLLALAHFTDGRYPRGLVLERGQLVIDARQLSDAQLQVADTCKAGVDEALARSGHSLTDMNFLSVFQGTAWLQGAVAKHLGTSTRMTEVFSRFGYLSAAAIPASLYLAELADGDLVLLTGGGTGQTYGAAVVRWGTA